MYASLDSGSQLLSWYKPKLEQKLESIPKDFSSTIEISNDVKELSEIIAAETEVFQASQSSSVSKAILLHQQHYLNQLEITKKELQKNSSSVFEAYKEEKIQTELSQLEEEVNNILADLLN